MSCFKGEYKIAYIFKREKSHMTEGVHDFFIKFLQKFKRMNMSSSCRFL